MVTTSLDDVIYVSTNRRIKSKRILTWKERLYRLRDAGHLKDAIRLALLFYRNEAPGKGFDLNLFFRGASLIKSISFLKIS